MVKKLQIIGKFPSDDLTLPPVTEQDNDKFLKVVDGKWAVTELPVYNGEIEIVPSANDEVTLLTAKKLLDSNIRVKKIPYSEVSNTSGGTTATIGSEV